MAARNPLLTRGPVFALAFVFLLASTGRGWSQGADCNRNSRSDFEEIRSGASQDCNGNFVPDECEVAPLGFRVRDGSIEFSRSPRIAIVRDLNGDGASDVVVGLRSSNLSSSIAVLRNPGDGRLEPPVEYAAGRQLAGLTAGDPDGDGDLDLISSNSTALHFFEHVAPDGEAPGVGPVFREAIKIPVPATTRALRVADLDADGRDEIVVSTAADDTVSILRLLEDGTSSSVSLPVGREPGEVEITDIDDDGELDIVVLEEMSATVSILRGDGTGAFAPATPLATEAAPLEVRVADMDGDGDLDLVTLHEGSISVLENRAKEGFVRGLSYSATANGLVVRDLDGDGDPDLAFTNRQTDSVEGLTNLGDGILLPSTQLASIWKVQRIAPGDLDGDGDPELFALAHSPNRGTVLGNGERGTLTLTGTEFFIGHRPHGGTIRDFNGDGILDLATSNGHQSTLGILLGDGTGALGPTKLFVIQATQIGSQLFSPRAADFDRDGDLDIVMADRESQSLIVTFNEGDGTFFNPVAYDAGFGTRSCATADVNGDGHPDLLSANAGADAVLVFLNHRNGTFAPALPIHVAGGPGELVHTDFDGDGDVDLAVANISAATVSILLGDGQGGFTENARLATSRGLGFVVLGHFDSGATIDVAAVGTATITVFFGQGDGSFRRGPDVPVAVPTGTATAADLDLDGLDDLVTTSASTVLAATLLSVGDGTFHPPTIFNFGPETRFVATADMDGDGDQDIVTGNRPSFSATVFLNQSDSAATGIDFLEAICTPADFHSVSTFRPTGRVERRVGFLVPSRSDPDLLPGAFFNPGRFASAREFLSTLHPAQFGELTEAGFSSLVLQRETRNYFTGTIASLRLLGGELVYGLSVDTDTHDPTQRPTPAELETLFASTTASFPLGPLGYVPQNDAEEEVAATWEVSFPIFANPEPSVQPPEPPPIGFPTFLLEVPPGTEMCATFALAGATRGPSDEYRLKSRVRFHEGIIELPTTAESFPGDLFAEVLFGPDQERATPTSMGEFHLQSFPGNEVLNYRFTYEQAYGLASGQSLVLRLVSPLTFQGRGDDPVAGSEGRVLTEDFLIARPNTEAFQATLDNVPLIRYGSCFNEPLPLWNVRAELADGTIFRLEERWDPAVSLEQSGPASLERAELTLAGQEFVEADYFRLVYSAFRHNEGARYWIVLDPPVQVAGASAPVHVVELGAPSDLLEIAASARYLGTQLEEVGSPAVTRFEKERSLVPVGPRFLRGDSQSSGQLEIVDGLVVLRHVFARQPIPCAKAGDFNDDGRLSVVDAIGIVRALFTAQTPVPAPFPTCGTDPTEDALSCATPPRCQEG